MDIFRYDLILLKNKVINFHKFSIKQFVNKISQTENLFNTLKTQTS